jgi:SAM-dependent methyltransferase
VIYARRDLVQTPATIDATSHSIGETLMTARTDTAICPTCAAAPLKPFLDIGTAPANSCILCDDRTSARAYPRGIIHLGACPGCGFVSNMRFDESLTEYSQRYEETQGFSPTFSRFSSALARELARRHDLHHKRIIEIGCGKGEFLVDLCQQGDNTGIGFDPAFVEQRLVNPAPGRIRFIRDFYSERYAGLEADFVCCKMTIEHIAHTGAFVRMISRTIQSPDTVVFFQAPNAERIFTDCAFEDIYYEHCSYFSESSLRRLFAVNGFSVERTEMVYDNQYVTLEARRARPAERPASRPDSSGTVPATIESFADRYREKTAQWRERIESVRAAGNRAVVWGSGSKAVAFLESVDPRRHIEYAVDINPHRWDAYMPGGAQRIVSPDFLRRLRPEVIIVMNRMYRSEIAHQVQQLGLEPEVWAL